MKILAFILYDFEHVCDFVDFQIRSSEKKLRILWKIIVDIFIHSWIKLILLILDLIFNSFCMKKLINLKLLLNHILNC